MADTSTGQYTPPMTPKVLMASNAKKKKKKKKVKAGSYNKKARKDYEAMLKEAAS